MSILNIGHLIAVVTLAIGSNGFTFLAFSLAYINAHRVLTQVFNDLGFKEVFG